MSDERPSAELVQSVRGGSESAAGALFDRYVGRLTRLARMRLAVKLQQRFDPEDVVLSVYRSFFVAARKGRLTIEHPGDLWRLLARMTLYKLSRKAVHHTAQKRTVADERMTSTAGDFVDREPTPDEAVAFADELEALMQSLQPIARRVLELRLQGYGTPEIADDINRDQRTVRRLMTTIRDEIGKRGDFRVTADFRENESHQQDVADDHAEDESTDIPVREAAADISISATDEISNLSNDLFERIGERRFADYRLQQHIGTGATGRVYRSLEIATGSIVAVKFLRKDVLANSSIVKRFIEEADVVTRLDHPTIVRIHGVGRTPIGGFFIVQDWIDGASLADKIEEDLPDFREAGRWIAAAADGIQHAHEQGIVHCDLKPGNLLLGHDGRIHITDFGLWRPMDAPVGSTDAIAGTLGFMAPEQVEPACGPIGAATDVYGLGAVLYCMLTGRPPVTGGRFVEVLSQIVLGQRIPPLRSLRGDIPGDFTAVVERCLKLKPEDRYQSASDVADALKAVVSESPPDV